MCIYTHVFGAKYRNDLSTVNRSDLTVSRNTANNIFHQSILCLRYKVIKSKGFSKVFSTPPPPTHTQEEDGEKEKKNVLPATPASSTR